MKFLIVLLQSKAAPRQQNKTTNDLNERKAPSTHPHFDSVQLADILKFSGKQVPTHCIRAAGAAATFDRRWD